MAWAGLQWTKKTEEWMHPAEGVITSSCGKRMNPILGKWELHNGLDIAMKEGTEVVAVKSGVVTQVRVSSSYGNVVNYKTKDGYEIMYAHLKEPLVEVNQEVKQGDVIALSGNTGLSTGPHLHYSVWLEGMLLDPMKFVNLKYTNDVIKEYRGRGEWL